MLILELKGFMFITCLLLAISNSRYLKQFYVPLRFQDSARVYHNSW